MDISQGKIWMIGIDGSYGEGGGQIIRTSLALSLVTGKSFSVHKIRASRKKPGLMRQHLTAVNAAVEIGSAEIEGNHIGSQSFTFRPKTIKPGKFHFAIGSAGSCTLVFQTILPALLTAAKPSEILLEGGTHNPFAPPFDFLDQAFLPVICQMGPMINAVLERPGFFPAGGGRFKVSINPSPLKRIDLMERGRIINKTARAYVANLPVNIANRELKVIRKKLEWDGDEFQAIEVKNSRGPGNVITIEIKNEYITEVFTGFGQKGVLAENVAKQTVKLVQEYLACSAPVGRYLADQLLIPMALVGGGRFRTLSPTQHTVTNIAIIKKFLDVEIKVSEYDQNLWEIEIGEFIK